jgi:hypothetical protein
MRYDVTFRRMSAEASSHLLHYCVDIETAIRLTREQYPGCLIINVVATE